MSELYRIYYENKLLRPNFNSDAEYWEYIENNKEIDKNRNNK